MPGVWQRLRGRVAALLVPRAPLPIRQRFAGFRAVCAANDEFLRTLSGLMELRSSPQPLVLETVRAGHASLCASARTMARALLEMSGGRYADFVQRCDELAHQSLPPSGRAASDPQPPWVIWPDNPDALRADIAGGKAADLSRLTGVPEVRMPPFFIITAAAYRHLMHTAGLQGRALELLKISPGHGLSRAHCEAVCRDVRASAMPADLGDVLRAAYRRLVGFGRAPHGVAVRSSAVMEDSDASFAGQFDTVLGVRGDNLLAAYQQVVASRFAYEAVHYARRSGYGDEDLAMPVVVMAMVQPAASGVAHSQAPERDDAILVTAVRGLAQAAMDGRVTPDRLLVSRRPPHAVLERVAGADGIVLRCGARGGLVEELAPHPPSGQPAIADDLARGVAKMALRLEWHLGGPQEVEWAVDERGRLFVVQARALGLAPGLVRPERPAPVLAGRRLLLTGATRACGGVACSVVARLLDLESLDSVPERVVLVVPATTPKLSVVVGRVAAIVAESGSPTGHLATVAREFGVPTLVGALGATAVLHPGLKVTVDAWSGNVYEGRVDELLDAQAAVPAGAMFHEPARRRLEALLARVAPLTLKDPTSNEFTVANCKSLHDVARFAHQRAMVEMFALDRPSRSERGAARRLRWRAPMDVLVLDLDGGVEASAGRVLEMQDIRSAPLRALLAGMTDPRVSWAGPIGFDFKGFVSVVVRSAADDQRYGEPSFVLCSEDYLHFSSRLAYHFASIDSMCTASPNQNFVRFLFFGGAAVAERREHRAHFLATVLGSHGFDVRRDGDRVEGLLGKHPARTIEESLVMVGRLMVSARHCDMVMDSRSTAEAYANAFLSGDFSFDFVRRPAP
jgi:pyruvate,water dikinase